jgi:hypothetical protein
VVGLDSRPQGVCIDRTDGSSERGICQKLYALRFGESRAEERVSPQQQLYLRHKRLLHTACRRASSGRVRAYGDTDGVKPGPDTNLICAAPTGLRFSLSLPRPYGLG